MRSATETLRVDYSTGGRKVVYKLSRDAQRRVTALLRRRPQGVRQVTHVYVDHEPAFGDTLVYACDHRGVAVSAEVLADLDGDRTGDPAALAEIGVEEVR